jgi:hypothetical protein
MERFETILEYVVSYNRQDMKIMNSEENSFPPAHKYSIAIFILMISMKPEFRKLFERTKF